MSKLVSIKTYSSQTEAEAAKILLEANGVKAAACPATCGTRSSVFAWLCREFDVLVFEKQADAAMEVLASVGDVFAALEIADERDVRRREWRFVRTLRWLIASFFGCLFSDPPHQTSND